MAARLKSRKERLKDLNSVLEKRCRSSTICVGCLCRNKNKTPGLMLQKIGADVYHDAAHHGQLVVQSYLLRKSFGFLCSHFLERLRL